GFLDADRAHAGTAVRDPLDDAFVGQVDQCGAHCAAAGMESFAELGFDQPLLGCVFVAEDGAAQRVHDGFVGECVAFDAGSGHGLLIRTSAPATRRLFVPAMTRTSSSLNPASSSVSAISARPSSTGGLNGCPRSEDSTECCGPTARM